MQRGKRREGGRVWADGRKQGRLGKRKVKTKEENINDFCLLGKT